MVDLYNVEEKAGLRQQLRSRLALLQDEIRRNEKEHIELLADHVKLLTQLDAINEESK